MKQLVPWLATFLFGCSIFLVGKVLQHYERLRRIQEKAAMYREREISAALRQVHGGQQEPKFAGIMEAVRGQGQGAPRQVH